MSTLEMISPVQVELDMQRSAADSASGNCNHAWSTPGVCPAARHWHSPKSVLLDRLLHYSIIIVSQYITKPFFYNAAHMRITY